MDDSTNTTGKTWWQRLTGGLRRTSSSIGDAITDLVTKRKLDAAAIEGLEEVLIRADLGIDTAGRVAAAIAEGRYDKDASPDDVKAILAAEVEKILTPVAKPLAIAADARPFVILVVGVNGSGKTTTIGKLAARLTRERKTVTLVAGDTFRAAAIEQLKIWSERTGSGLVSGETGADAAGLAYEALAAARAKGTDVLIVDTAGRLQNKTALMGDLDTIVRVVKKLAGVTGLVMTKLDGTARGGILVALAAKYGLPVHFIGVGEGVDDLAPFAAADFARAIAGLDY